MKKLNSDKQITGFFRCNEFRLKPNKKQAKLAVSEHKRSCMVHFLKSLLFL
jgi:hypothetical protein